MDDGVKNVKSALAGITVIFVSLVKFSVSLMAQGVSLQSNYEIAIETNLQNSGGCRAIDTLGFQGFITQYRSGVSDFNVEVSGIPGQANQGKDLVDQYAVFYRNIAFYLPWSMAIAFVYFMIVFIRREWKNYTKISMFGAMVTFIIELIITAVFMILTSVTGDVCTPSPTFNILGLLPTGSVRSIATFYTTCVGPNKIGNQINGAQDNIVQLNATLFTLGAFPGCQRENNIGIDGMFTDLNRIFADFEGAGSNLVCAPIQSLWFTFINEGVCKNLYTGFYSFWLAQLITSFFVLLAIALASFCYQYFDKVDPGGEIDVIPPRNGSGEVINVEMLENTPKPKDGEYKDSAKPQATPIPEYSPAIVPPSPSTAPSTYPEFKYTQPTAPPNY
eukprot:CAMPEP_0119043002 /NCGR_PEP_ID=MMETSP1177-20130426/16332_1 /TAXON_ID=2985 /ORGANISM="Ochromonas sp, Strain CCMP1899" /LENGTH=388 /DNA_ID=CAMNT_0007010151 /DNA_START=625 /DNA_END=1791 /DNA_ORIENTATION=+